MIKKKMCRICGDKERCVGLCSKHYDEKKRRAKGILPRATHGMTLRERVDYYTGKSTESGCLPWIGTVDKYGYGYLTVTRNGSRRPVGAHRVSYELAFGTFDAELHVCHKCDNPPCVNPEHLFLGTNQENTADRHRKNRDAKGERSGQAKLVANQVLEIYSSPSSTREIARRYSISQQLASRIKRKEVWKHLWPETTIGQEFE